ncbi:EcsC protein family protein [Micromonospora mirobrigensis]|uniref:EcsC protein family protein n=1 Tax=Micromonospora mirobrigensis TaxID=262898 RepID=A0A1C5AP02_9ACTN|nr:EcsC protein family protein [Micromonospora mirobrigensis]
MAPRARRATSKKAGSPAAVPPAKTARSSAAVPPVKKAGPQSAKAAPAKKTTGATGQAAPAPKVAAGRKSSAPRKAASATKATPAPAEPQQVPAAVQQEQVTATPVRVPAQLPYPSVPEMPASGRTREWELATLTGRLRDHPGFAPELLALAAVEALGPRARDWTQRLRAAYPQAESDALARLASRRFVRAAGVGGAGAAVAGLFAPVAELAAVLWTQANLVLHLAATYGRDPLDPERAVELLVLTQVHPDAASARAALDAARAADGPAERSWPWAAEAAWRLALPLAAQAGGWLALRLASRLLPGAAVLAAATGDAAAAERLAARAIGTYRPR